MLYVLNFFKEIWLPISIKHHYVPNDFLILHMLNFFKEIWVFISIKWNYVAEKGHDKFICFLTSTPQTRYAHHRFTSDKKSLFTVTNLLFYFLHAKYALTWSQNTCDRHLTLLHQTFSKQPHHCCMYDYTHSWAPPYTQQHARQKYSKTTEVTVIDWTKSCK